MISKTTSSNFVKFGTIVQNIPDEDFIVEEFTVSTKEIHDMYSYNQAVYLEAFEGMAMVSVVRHCLLLCCKTPCILLLGRDT